jgi:phosphatidylethanolamine/phosphatidyl-N-methylethanolamine N-methyltransferase
MTDPQAGAALPAHVQWLAFFRQWLKNPRRVASVAPSGRQLARMMVHAMPRGACSVVELGAGTGAITEALIDDGIGPDHLLVVEMNAVLHRMLQRRFPDACVACADARDLGELVECNAGFAAGGVDAVLSSLGLLAMPRPMQRDIVAAAFRVLRPGGVFVQYTYGVAGPLAEEVRWRLGLRCDQVGLAWRNLPPARVFVYSRASA